MKKGDLIHVPQGTVLYKYSTVHEEMLNFPSGIIITNEPSVGIFLKENLSVNMHEIMVDNQKVCASRHSIYYLTNEETK
jgi:hypothetical protein